MPARASVSRTLWELADQVGPTTRIASIPGARDFSQPARKSLTGR
jgi:hypothetical protein